MKMKCKIISVKTLKKKTYETLDLGDDYNALFGRMQTKFVMMCYGASGSGKSVFALKLAERLSGEGKVLYNSHEEKDNKTLQDRVNDFNITASGLYFGISLDFDEMLEEIRRKRYSFVVIDSVQYMNFTYSQLKQLCDTFRKKKKLGIIMVSFGNNRDNPDKARDLLHASDVKCFFKHGKLNVVSRYLSSPVDRFLFNSVKSNQLSLF
jgi:predicted ATP-dependent serine protease